MPRMTTKQLEQLNAARIKPTGFATPVDEALSVAVQQVVTKLDPERIILFGSYAYGTPTVDSDVDLLVVVNTSKKATQRYLQVSRLLRPRPFPVDILVRTPDEIAQALKSGDFFIEGILSRGRVLYERDH